MRALRDQEGVNELAENALAMAGEQLEYLRRRAFANHALTDLLERLRVLSDQVERDDAAQLRLIQSFRPQLMVNADRAGAQYIDPGDLEPVA